MTTQEVIEEAAKLGGWYIDKIGCIRRGPGLCPIIAVANARFPECHYATFHLGQAASRLPLEPGVLSAIVDAADGRETPTRRLMIEKFGL